MSKGLTIFKAFSGVGTVVAAGAGAVVATVPGASQVAAEGASGDMQGTGAGGSGSVSQDSSSSGAGSDDAGPAVLDSSASSSDGGVDLSTLQPASEPDSQPSAGESIVPTPLLEASDVQDPASISLTNGGGEANEASVLNPTADASSSTATDDVENVTPGDNTPVGQVVKQVDSVDANTPQAGAGDKGTTVVAVVDAGEAGAPTVGGGEIGGGAGGLTGSSTASGAGGSTVLQTPSTGASQAAPDVPAVPNASGGTSEDAASK